MSLGLTDRRGECIFAACPHYRKCFIEKNVRAARKADVVIANHALVMFQASLEHSLGALTPDSGKSDEDSDETTGPKRLVFDEGHHLFDAADNAFSAHLTGMETAELRRWLRGAENRRRRGRSLSDRIGELLDDIPHGDAALQQVLEGARALPGPGWRARIEAGMAEGPAEEFLQLVRQQTLARAGPRGGMSIETDCRPLIDGLADAAGALAAALGRLRRPMDELARMLVAQLDERADELDSATRARLDSLARSIRRRSALLIPSWKDMLRRLEGEGDASFVEWFSIDYQFGREFDYGQHSHWIDPTVPLAAAVLTPADGVVITSATLKDRPPQAPDDWENAEMRTGVVHLPWPVRRIAHSSPFDYGANARIIAVNDLGRENMDHLAAAYRELFLAAKGGALGLFTAISRLRAVHQRLAAPLAAAGYGLFAQHVDPVDTGTLVDMFRSETNACLLGTDAVRDGVDVPGKSLRLIVQDRVPWPQPSILERARQQAFGRTAWQDMIVRLRLRQAFGRLIRRRQDRGLFVMLDSRLASRFASAFPPDVKIERMGLADAVDAVGSFLHDT
ncbi:MAG TPA: ATP-dependent DNA helicase [Rhizobiales bacterium]|nr:ATP-dependent DNA helicase [Hyphomicrobiales bacterium]